MNDSDAPTPLRDPESPGDAVPEHTFGTALRLGASALWRRPRLTVPFLLLTLLQGVFQTLLIYAITHVLRGTDLVLGAVLVFSVWCARAWTAYAALILTTKIAFSAEIEATNRVLRRVLRRPIGFFDSHSRGDLLITSYQDVIGVRIATLQVGKMLLYLSRILALGVAAVHLDAKLALIGLCCIPLVFLPAYSLGQRIKRAALEERVRKRMLHDNFMQVARGAAMIKAYHLAPRILMRAREISARLLAASVDKARRSGASRALLETASGIGLAIIICVGGADIAAGRLEWQALVGILMALVALYQPVLNLLASYNSICGVIPQLNKILALRHEARPTGSRRRATRLRDAPATIQLDGVSFEYGEEPVLTDVTLSFERGETIGIVGQTGSGKSTLLALIMGLRDPTAGSVRYDAHDLATLRKRDVYALTAYVPQEPVLFMDSVADNIRIGRSDATDAEVVAAAQAAQIHDEISEMPEGYATVLGEGAGSLDGSETRGVSVGQKQRICIAAAILSGAPLVFLDEATSSIDSSTERKIQSATDRLTEGRTAFVIAHRLTTLRSASRIVVLHRGRIVGFGTHEDLLDTSSHYQELWHAQRQSDGP